MLSSVSENFTYRKLVRIAWELIAVSRFGGIAITQHKAAGEAGDGGANLLDLLELGQ